MSSQEGSSKHPSRGELNGQDSRGERGTKTLAKCRPSKSVGGGGRRQTLYMDRGRPTEAISEVFGPLGVYLTLQHNIGDISTSTG